MASDSKSSVSSSIQTKVILTSVIIVTLVLAGFAAFDYLSERNEKYQTLDQSAMVSAQRLATNLSIPLWDLDEEVIDESLESEMRDPNIVAIIVRDSDGSKVFAAKERTANWATADASASLLETGSSNSIVQSDIRKSATIEYKADGSIGSVEVYGTVRFVNDALRSSLVRIVTTVFVLDVVIFIVLLIQLRSLIIKPVMILSQAADRMSRGELDVELDTDRNDEVGVLAQSLHRMQVSLNYTMERLKQKIPPKNSPFRS